MRVLVPLDGSDRSFHALEGALELLAGTSPSLTLFNVRQAGFEGAPEHAVVAYDRDEEDEIFPNEASAMRMLERGAAMCRKRGIEPELRVVEGRYVEAVLAEAKGHDLVVMHALDRGELKEKLRGSKTERIARECGASVLLVRD